MSFQSLITVDPLTFIAQICNLFIQMLLFKKLLYDKVVAVLDQRKKAADSQIASAQQTRADAEQMKTEYEADMKNAKAKAGEIISSAQKAASERSEQLISEARVQATGIRQKAEADALQSKKQAVDELKNEIGGMAVTLASKVVEREINEKDHEELIDEFIRNVGDAS